MQKFFLTPKANIVQNCSWTSDALVKHLLDMEKEELYPSSNILQFCDENWQGMSEDVSINKFFDEAMMVELAQQAADLHQQMIW